METVSSERMYGTRKGSPTAKVNFIYKLEFGFKGALHYKIIRVSTFNQQSRWGKFQGIPLHTIAMCKD